MGQNAKHHANMMQKKIKQHQADAQARVSGKAVGDNRKNTALSGMKKPFVNNTSKNVGDVWKNNEMKGLKGGGK